MMHEVLHALKRLKERGEVTTIDLKSMPFGPGDEEALLSYLGCGEVTIELQSLGKSRICETFYPGVWLVDHYNATGDRIALSIEINRVPEIVRSQTEDISHAITRLEQQLNPDSTA
ncbi:MAG: hydrogenase accessory protein HupE [gamma proteobacterium symbiont of Ctena orbiculata]|nr:hydrogenase expression/formation protein [Candidatus Thiodiazotropha taylori]MBT3058994.1 hydrogenase expression/formation protein [Candidatus Thiodiazotropha sp. (ex Lucina pensylvanica)]MBV2096321.1 hydrogenase expression/formation protein [Candidatus Thiodiazotropha sp. (ex Codakia orbicularis)]PUB73176.1 MAG: hydrogenase accessory protein HupE [gamma proteobacterium symbiont of Ctena orbiculata]MBT3063832.1 hydrogenase expression/formation protein [Candidatus Thiodiazotropha sp. (ex Luci